MLSARKFRLDSTVGFTKNYNIISHKGILVLRKSQRNYYLYKFAHFWVQFEAVWYRKSCHHPRFKEICEKNFTVAPQQSLFWSFSNDSLLTCLNHSSYLPNGLAPSKQFGARQGTLNPKNKILRFWSLLYVKLWRLFLIFLLSFLCALTS